MRCGARKKANIPPAIDAAIVVSEGRGGKAVEVVVVLVGELLDGAHNRAVDRHENDCDVALFLWCVCLSVCVDCVLRCVCVCVLICVRVSGLRTSFGCARARAGGRAVQTRIQTERGHSQMCSKERGVQKWN